MREIILSVIIPIYNAELYLKRAIDSVLLQKKDNVEIVLVNDGSTDGSLSLCEEYEANNELVTIVNKINGGLSSARNAGINKACGKYIVFLDADDFLETGCLDKIIDVVLKYNVDMLDFGICYIAGENERNVQISTLPKNIILDKAYMDEYVIPIMINLQNNNNIMDGYSVTKVYKRELLNKYNIRFDENRRVWEDKPFVVQCLKYVNSYYSMEECFYNYVSTVNSLSRRYNKFFLDIIYSNYLFYKELYGDKYEFETEYAINYWCNSIENMIIQMLEFKEKRAETIEQIEKIIINEQIQEWYLKRSAVNSFQKETSNLVKKCKFEELINLYVKKANKNLSLLHMTKLYLKIHQVVRKVLKR